LFWESVEWNKLLLFYYSGLAILVGVFWWFFWGVLCIFCECVRVLVMGTHINLLGACKMQPSMMMTRAIAHTGSEIVQFSRHFGVMAQFGKPPAAAAAATTTTTTVNFVKQQKSSEFLAPHRFSIPEPLVMVMIPGQSQNARPGFGILEREKNLARSCARVCCCASISGSSGISSSTTQEGRDAAPSSFSTLEVVCFLLPISQSLVLLSLSFRIFSVFFTL
jgi:hypothetical protein